MENEEQLIMSYLAGVMDGDGSFSLIKKIECETRSPLYSPLIQLGSLSSDLIEFIKATFGGSSSILKEKVGKDGIKRRQFYRWKAEKSSQCTIVLQKLCNFLVIKKERAQFLKTYIEQNPFIRGSKRLSQDVLNEREFAYRKMRALNEDKKYFSGFSKEFAKNPTDNQLFWSYLAGLIDTDGSLSIRKNKPTVKNKNYRYTPMILLSMNDIRGFNFIRENCPFGNYKVYKAKSCVTGMTNRLTIHKREEVVKVLTKIMPYLRVKKEQAKVLLNFCNNFVPVLHRQNSIPQEQLNFREESYQQLINCNKYGVSKPSLIDLEAQEQGNKAEGENHRKRLNEMDSEKSMRKSGHDL